LPRRSCEHSERLAKAGRNYPNVLILKSLSRICANASAAQSLQMPPCCPPKRFVYVIRSEPTGRTYIGLTSNFERRLAELTAQTRDLDAKAKESSAKIGTLRTAIESQLRKIGVQALPSKLRRRTGQKPSLGDVYSGRVVRLTDFGAFVEVLPGMEGLLHVSEMANHKVMNVRDELNEGDEIDVLVIYADPKGGLRLSWKALISVE